MMRNQFVAETEPHRYLTFLHEFMGTYGQSITLLKDLLSSGAHDDALELAHALRGTSGMIGVAGVEKLAQSLEHALKTGQEMSEILELADRIDEKLDNIGKSILGLGAVRNSPHLYC